MPPKVRQLVRKLEKAGFENLGGKGSHRKFWHSCGARLTLSGKLGSDAKPYQIRAVKIAIDLTKNEDQ